MLLKLFIVFCLHEARKTYSSGYDLSEVPHSGVFSGPRG